jgi:hypothetical protein
MAEGTREYEYELISYGKREESLGTTWWNGNKVEASKPSLLSLLKETRIVSEDKNLTIDDGIAFLEALPNYFRSYVSARKVIK